MLKLKEEENNEESEVSNTCPLLSDLCAGLVTHLLWCSLILKLVSPSCCVYYFVMFYLGEYNKRKESIVKEEYKGEES